MFKVAREHPCVGNAISKLFDFLTDCELEMKKVWDGNVLERESQPDSCLPTVTFQAIKLFSKKFIQYFLKRILLN